MGLDVPQVLQLAKKLRENGFEISDDVITVDEIEKEILRCIKEDRNNA